MLEQNSPKSGQNVDEGWSLSRETRWSRTFTSPDGRKQLRRYRFEDGSAEITPDQLASEWDDWHEEQKKDFCDAAAHLPKEKCESILRFLIAHADCNLLHNTALAIAENLKHSESVPWLIASVMRSNTGAAIAFIQALAWTRSPPATSVIERRLCQAWEDPRLFQDDAFVNWIALEALQCVRYLIELGRSPADYMEKANQLSNHACLRVRQAYGWYLAKHFES